MLESFLKHRLKKGKEHPERWPERMGHYTRPRPEGKLLWCHAASVGESLALLALIKRILEDYPSWQVMVTTGTVTSAKLMAERLPDKAFHQFIPMDRPKWVKRFLEYWQPDLGIWMESELWPNLIRQTKKRGIPILLINARMSDKSYANWKKGKIVACKILGYFDEILAQSQEDAKRYTVLLCNPKQPVVSTGNLKWDAELPKLNQTHLQELQNAIGSRPFWLASSIHAGDDAAILTAQNMIKKQFPDILTILLPRHPQRATDLQTLIQPEQTALRSSGTLPTNDQRFYIADTMGETNLFYELCPIVCMGGSFFEHGGQNMLEPASQGCALLTGPYTFNFKDIMATLKSYKAITITETGEALGREVIALLQDPFKQKTQQTAARTAAASLSGAVDRTMITLQRYLEAET